jgi:hypothetical protein
LPWTSTSQSNSPLRRNLFVPLYFIGSDAQCPVAV